LSSCVMCFIITNWLVLSTYTCVNA
jgi:hypothetical protein